MLFAVKRFMTPASFKSRLSSKPNMGAGRTIVVSGKMLRTTCSPRPFDELARNITPRRTVPHLGSEEVRGRGRIGIVRGHMDEPINIVLGHSFGDPFNAPDVHVLE